jgi:Protein of unknown function DUF86
LKARHASIPWPKVAGIGNVLRHDYEQVAHDVLWHVVRDDLPLLEKESLPGRTGSGTRPRAVKCGGEEQEQGRGFVLENPDSNINEIAGDAAIWQLTVQISVSVAS